MDAAVDVDDAGVEEGGLPKSELAMRIKEKFKCGRGVYLGDARDDTRRRRGDAAGGGGRGARFDGLLPEALDALAPVGIEWSVRIVNKQKGRVCLHEGVDGVAPVVALVEGALELGLDLLREAALDDLRCVCVGGC